MGIPDDKHQKNYFEQDREGHIQIGKANPNSIRLNSEYYIKEAFLTSPEKGCELLFIKYYGHLCSHAVRYVYSKELAEDIVSEVFRRFWEKKVFENITTSYISYLFTSVRNESYTYIKKEFKKFDDVEKLYLSEGASSFNPYNITLFEEIQHRLKVLVTQLPPQQKKAFMLNRFDGKTYPEVATEMGVTVKMVEAHISKALNFVKNGLKEYLPMILTVFYLT